MKIIKAMLFICCAFFGHDYKKVGNQKGRWYKCKRCGFRIITINRE